MVKTTVAIKPKDPDNSVGLIKGSLNKMVKGIKYILGIYKLKDKRNSFFIALPIKSGYSYFV
jgi:hypothetical protein